MEKIIPGITYHNLDISTVTYGIIAHGVNCQGVMGSGVAFAIRKAFPGTFERYREDWEVCMKDVYLNTVDFLGDVVFDNRNANLIICHCYTQNYYGNDGKRYADLKAIKRSLKIVFRHGERMYLPVYIPKIGCGLGGLDWETEVLPVVQELSEIYHVDVRVCSL